METASENAIARFAKALTHEPVPRVAMSALVQDSDLSEAAAGLPLMALSQPTGDEIYGRRAYRIPVSSAPLPVTIRLARTGKGLPRQMKSRR